MTPGEHILCAPKRYQSGKHSQIKDLDVRNQFYYRKVMWPQQKHISSGLIKYQKHSLKSKIYYIITITISIHKSCDTPSKTHFQ